MISALHRSVGATTLALFLAAPSTPAAPPSPVPVRLGGVHVPVSRIPETNDVHLLVQVSADAPADAWLRIRDAGTRPLARVSPTSWLVAVPRHRRGALLAQPWVTGVGPIPGEAKAAGPLRAMLRGGAAPRDVVVVFYPGVADAEARSAWRRAVGSVGDAIGTGRVRTPVRVTPAQLRRLVAEDGVHQVWPARRPRQVENQASRDTADVEQIAVENPYVRGATVRAGVWDGGAVRATHEDLTGRVVQRDGATASSNHATHVTGTIISDNASGQVSGETSTLGMAPEATVWAYDFDADIAEMDADGDQIDVSNHSYGFVTGWSFNFGGSGEWHWFGEPGSDRDVGFGKYDLSAADFDGVVFQHGFPVVKSAGNDRDDDGTSGDHYHGEDTSTMHADAHRADGAEGGYDTVAWFGNAKNILTVGAVTDVTADPVTGAAVAVLGFSGFGPVDDGRIKPDVVANGQGLFSSTAASDNAASSASGTSMSAASATGAVALLIDRGRQLPRGAVDVEAAEARAVLVHGAVDAGLVGPDYMHGWGLINARNSMALLDGEFGTSVRIRRDAVTPSRSVQDLVIRAGSGGVLKATLAWTDPPGLADTSLDDDVATPALVNDLDLVLISPTGVIHHPWSLEPATPGLPAVRSGPDRVNNLEQVLVDIAAMEDGDWTARVSLYGLLDGSEQAYTLVVGFACGPDDPDCDGCAFDAVEDPESDGWCASSDNCPAAFNPLQRDRDRSGVGDACDPTDGLVTGVLLDAANGSLHWDAETGAFSYNVYRHVLTAPVPGDAGSCWQTGLTDTVAAVTGAPAVGEVWLFQVTAEMTGGEGPLGESSDGSVRQPAAPCS